MSARNSLNLSRTIHLPLPFTFYPTVVGHLVVEVELKAMMS